MEDLDPSLLFSKYQFEDLAAAAAELNQVTDQLTKSIADLDAAIASLSLGVKCWVNIYEASDDPRWSEELGYEKITGKWGLAIRVIENPSGRIDNQWLFADAPRDLRVQAVDAIPRL